MKFRIHSRFKPAGSQPLAINQLIQGLKLDNSFQTLIGVTGSGKTFTIAHLIEKYNKPTLVIAHNKTLATQLYNEFKELFPDNRVEYFVSYYDYYQPESYIPTTDQYIEKDSQINQKIEQMRLSATASVLSREDTIIVASVSCIYGLGKPSNFQELGFEVQKGVKFSRKRIIQKLIEILFERNEFDLQPGKFRVKGDTIDIVPGYYNNIIRIELFGDEVESIKELDKNTGNLIQEHNYFFIYPARHFVVSQKEIDTAIESIKKELVNSRSFLGAIEEHRLNQRTLYDIELIKETGSCKGIENYSLHFDGRKKGEKPYCLLDYFPDDFLIVIDESHQSIPQIRGMYEGDKSRKRNLIEYGFRLQTAYDNRPLKFNEFEKYMEKNKTIFVSATPGDYEIKKSSNVVEQIIRPTGLVDPIVEVREKSGQIDDFIKEIKLEIEKNNRVLATTITKKLSEELSEYLSSRGIKTRYLHSEIKTLQRDEIIRQLRVGKFDVLVGINLLREGLDIPEVSLIGIFDADKEGFLRDTKSLIQTIGRAARNINPKVILYADRITDSMKFAISETNRRREIQIEYNLKNNITPKQIIKTIKSQKIEIFDTKYIPKAELATVIEDTMKEMNEASDNLDFEKAIALRDKLKILQKGIKDKSS